jgi:hypothetical protein
MTKTGKIPAGETGVTQLLPSSAVAATAEAAAEM